MSEAKHYQTAPEDRIPFVQKVIFGSGAFVNNTLAAAMGGMIIVLNLGLGMNPALVGLLGALPRLTDAITDPLMGYISDNTQSRWGRRRASASTVTRRRWRSRGSGWPASANDSVACTLSMTRSPRLRVIASARSRFAFIGRAPS